MTFFAGQKPGADKLYALSYATTYVPTLTATTTDPDLGADGTISGWYHRNGLWISGFVQIIFSGAGISAGSGQYRVSLPFDADLSILFTGTANGAPIGDVYLYDSGTAANRTTGMLSLVSASAVQMNAAAGGGIVADSVPFTWADNDRINIGFAYIADPAGLPFGT